MKGVIGRLPGALSEVIKNRQLRRSFDRMWIDVKKHPLKKHPMGLKGQLNTMRVVLGRQLGQVALPRPHLNATHGFDQRV